MLRKRALRASSTTTKTTTTPYHLCVFCASRLGNNDALLPSAPATSHIQRRSIRLSSRSSSVNSPWANSFRAPQYTRAMGTEAMAQMIKPTNAEDRQNGARPRKFKGAAPPALGGMRRRKPTETTNDQDQDQEKDSIAAVFGKAAPPSPPPPVPLSNMSSSTGPVPQRSVPQSSVPQMQFRLQPQSSGEQEQAATFDQAKASQWWHIRPPQPQEQPRGEEEQPQRRAYSKNFVPLTGRRAEHFNWTMQRFNIDRRPLGERSHKPSVPEHLSKNPPGESAAAAASLMDRPRLSANHPLMNRPRPSANHPDGFDLAAMNSGKGSASPSIARPSPPMPRFDAFDRAATNSGEDAVSRMLDRPEQPPPPTPPSDAFDLAATNSGEGSAPSLARPSPPMRPSDAFDRATTNSGENAAASMLDKPQQPTNEDSADPSVARSSPPMPPSDAFDRAATNSGVDAAAPILDRFEQPTNEVSADPSVARPSPPPMPPTDAMEPAATDSGKDAPAPVLDRPEQPTSEGSTGPSVARPSPPPTPPADALEPAAINNGEGATAEAPRQQSAPPESRTAPSENAGRSSGQRSFKGMTEIGGFKAKAEAKAKAKATTSPSEGDASRLGPSGFKVMGAIGGMREKMKAKGSLTPSTEEDAEAKAVQAQFGSADMGRTEGHTELAAREGNAERAAREAEMQAEREADRRAMQSMLSDSSPTMENKKTGEENQKTEEVAASQVQETQKQNEARTPSRLTRFSKFAVEEDEGPRKRKAQGGRGRASPSYEEAADHSMSRRDRKKEKKRQRAVEAPVTVPIQLPEYLSVVTLANKLRVRTEELVRKMEELGFEDINNDDILNAENAGLIAMEYNFEPVAADPSQDLDLYPAPEPEDWSVLPTRPPVVTIMGHVDHGKTTLLDYMRKSSVVATEFGGITQHIGAFSVPLSGGKTITFLDTPGHAAFLNMRQRGANVTDIVILVVAADDSVKPQTIEAIKHAKAARVPIIVAINKIDAEGANVERVKQDLARFGIDVEDYGGDVQAIPVSGKTGEGMQDLEEAITTLSEILDYRAPSDGSVEGWVLEASTKKSGRVATVLVRRGTLQVGSFIVAGQTYARVRTMKNEAGIDIPAVGPGMPAEIDGWRGQPEAGDTVLEATDEQHASEVVEYREANSERIQLAKDMEAINEARRLEHERREREAAREAAIAAAAEAGEEDPEAAVAAAEEAEKAEATKGVTEVPFIIKADVSGSVEAVVDYVMTVGNNEVRPRVLRSGVGPVSEFDVEYAATAGGHVVSFNVPLEQRLARQAELKGVRVLEQNIIYRLVDDVKAVLSEKLSPNVVHRVSGEATVLQLFSVTTGRARHKHTVVVAGCRVTNGQVQRGSKVRVLRGEKTVYDGTVSSLRSEKKDVTEMRKGTECGMSFEGWSDFQDGDSVQCYEEQFEKRYL